jgi:hypothetical protein
LAESGLSSVPAPGQAQSSARDSSQAADQTTGWALKKYFQRVPANFEKPE